MDLWSVVFTCSDHIIGGVLVHANSESSAEQRAKLLGCFHVEDERPFIGGPFDNYHLCCWLGQLEVEPGEVHQFLDVPLTPVKLGWVWELFNDDPRIEELTLTLPDIDLGT